MIYAGDGIWKSGGEKLAAQLATHFGAAVANSHTDYRGISIKHPQHIGQFDQASAAYEPDFILSIGARHQGSGYSSDHIPFKRLSNTGGTHIALGSDLEYVTNYPGLDLAIIGDEKNALERLLSVAMDDFPSTRYNLKREKALEAGTLWRSARRKSMRPDLENGVVRPGVVADVVDAELEAIGGGFVTNEQFAVSHESIPSGLGEKNNVYLRPPGGSEGWGVGAAIGAKLAAVDQPVVGFVGDGSLYYADSGIWTAVHHNIPVLYIITNNRAYGIVAGFFEEADGRMSDTGKYGGVVLEGMEPVKIAEAFGMEAESVDDESKVVDAVRRGLTIVNKENRPYLIEFKLPIGLPEGGVADQQYRMR